MSLNHAIELNSELFARSTGETKKVWGSVKEYKEDLEGQLDPKTIEEINEAIDLILLMCADLKLNEKEREGLASYIQEAKKIRVMFPTPSALKEKQLQRASSNFLDSLNDISRKIFLDSYAKSVLAMLKGRTPPITA